MNRDRLRAFAALALSVLLLPIGCSSPSYTSGGGGGGGTTSNVATITVNTGPLQGEAYLNGAFTSITLCVPGSTTQCQTIGGILVDTGSYGLRIEASALSLTLPQQNDSSSNPIVECAQFGSGFTWGPVQTADFTIAGESASSLPIQVMGTANFPDTDGGGASTCSTPYGGGGSTNSFDYDYAQNLGANGVLGIGNFARDCGTSCTVSGVSNPGFYYSCPTASTCVVTTEALASQVANPVPLFPTDNNGLIVELPSVPAASVATSLTGQLIFGIGTETNNGLGSATIYDVDTSVGNLTTEFAGQTYTDASFLDTGSNALFFAPTGTDLGTQECADLDDFFYCPANNEPLSGTIEGYSNGANSQANFTVVNADSVYDNSADDSDGVFNGLAGPYPGGAAAFDWGLPFFYGTNVYVAINGATTPGGTGPYVAF